MAIQKEIWSRFIQENLFKSNQFMDYCYNADDNVLNGAVVHIPQVGAKPTVVKNRSSFPATTVQRTDTDITYALNTYTTDPTHIPEAEKAELSYNKMESVIGEHILQLSETVADDLLISWAPNLAANQVRTSGALITSYMPGSTTTRKKLLKEDIKAARLVMDKQNVPQAERYMIISAEMFDQLMDDADLKGRDGMFGGELSLKDGVIVKLYGFNIIIRSRVAVYDNAGTPAVKALGAAGAATDNDVAYCYQKNAVERALGTITLFDDPGNPLYYGDIYSALVKMGGRKRRTNGEGIVAIIQTP